MIPIQISIIHFAQNYLQIYSIVDCLEIIFFIFIIFKISLWLKNDHTKPLLLYFYSYLSILFSSYFFQLTTVYQVMLATAPICFLLFIIYHQKSLQKSFIISKNKPITPAKLVHKEWLEILIRTTLIASYHKKNITCIIEQCDSLETLVDQPFILDIPIQKQIIDILLESVAFDKNKLIITHHSGNILSINASWSDLVMNELIFNKISDDQIQKEYAKIITSKTDAIVIHTNSNHQHHFIAYQGKIIEHITIDQALKLIKKLLYTKNNTNNVSKGTHHDQNKRSSLSSLY